MNWYDTITDDLGKLKDLVTEIGGDALEAVGLIDGEPEVHRDQVDNWIQQLSQCDDPRVWADKASDAIQTTRAWLDANGDHAERGEVDSIHNTLVEGRDAFGKMRDWTRIMKRLRKQEAACHPRSNDGVDELEERIAKTQSLNKRLESRWEDSIVDRKVMVAFRPRIRTPSGVVEGLFDRMNENQREIAELMVSANALVGNLGNALTSAKDRAAEIERHNAEVREMDRIGKCVTDGMLEETCREMSETLFTKWFRSKASRWYPRANEGDEVKLPLVEFDSSEPEYYPGIQRDGAIKGSGTVSTVNRSMGPMVDPESEGIAIIDFTFTAYFTAKNRHFKMSAIYEFNRVMAVANEDGSIVEGNHDFVKDFRSIGGDSEPVRR